MKVLARSFFPILNLIFLVLSFGCSSSNSTNSNNGNPGLSGVVQLARVSGATISVYAVSDSGEVGELLAQTTSDSDGAYSVSLGSYTGQVLVKSEGGVYTDEATNLPTTAATLYALVDSSEASTAPVTPISTLIKERTLALVTGGSSIEEAHDLSEAYVASMFGIEVADLSVLPASPTAIVATDESATRAALALAAFSHLMDDMLHNGNPVSVEDALEALADDLKDDGKANGSVASNTLATSLAVEWKGKLTAGRAAAMLNTHLFFKDLEEISKTAFASKAIDTENDFFETSQEDENTIQITGALPPGFTYTGSMNFKFGVGIDLAAGNVITTSGTVTFLDGATNFGTVNGDVVFQWVGITEESPVNSGTINGDVTFLDGTNNSSTGVVNGNAVFNDGAINFGLVSGVCVLNNLALNDNDCARIWVGSYNKDTNTITVTESPAPQYEDVTFSFSGTENYLISSGVGIPAHYSITTTGTVTFEGSSYNKANITAASVEFKDNSIHGVAPLNNPGCVGVNINASSVTFSGDSTNSGIINGNATFNGTSDHWCYVSGNATFNGSSGNFGGDEGVGGTITDNRVVE